MASPHERDTTSPPKEGGGGVRNLMLLKEIAGDESHLAGTGVRGYDLPAVVKLLEVHRGVPHHLLVGTREIDGPPSKRRVRGLA